MSTNQVRALEALRRFESAPDGERRGICSTWPADILVAPDGPEVARLALACNRHEGRLQEALGSLAALARMDGLLAIEGPLCREWQLLTERFGNDATTQAAGDVTPPVRCDL